MLLDKQALEGTLTTIGQTILPIIHTELITFTYTFLRINLGHNIYKTQASKTFYSS